MFVFLRPILLLFIAIVLCVGAFQGWQEHSINKKVLAGVHPLINDYDLSSVPSYLSEPLRLALLVAHNQVGTDARVLAIADEYIRRRPLDPSGFIHGSALSQRLGDKQKSLEYLAGAHQISGQSTHNLIRIFVRYLELDEDKKAYRVFKDLVYKNPVYFSKYFGILARTSDDFQSLVEMTIPEKLPNFREFDANYYYNHALRIALRYKKNQLADIIWNKVPHDQRFQFPSGNQYLEALRSQQDAEQFFSVWSDIEGGSAFALNDSNVTIDFEKDKNEITPCFPEGKMKGAKWFVDQRGFNSQRSMKLEFDGDHNVNFAHMTCTFSVTPGQYLLSGHWYGEDVTTRSGVFFEVVAYGAKGVYSKSETKNKTWRWMVMNMPVVVPEGVELVTLRVRRAKTDALDNKVSGSVWVDNIQLVKQ